MIINIGFKGRKTELEIDGTDTLKNILEKFYIKNNIKEDERFYTREKVIFKFGNSLLNSTEKDLYKTANELELQDDDGLELIKAIEIVPGRQKFSLI